MSCQVTKSTLSALASATSISYALTEAGKTRFDLQTLGGVRQYLNGYQQSRERRTATKTASEALQSKQRQTQLRMDYDQYRRTEAQRLLEKLPPGEQAEIEALARAKLSTGGPVSDYMAQTLIRVEKLRLTVELHPGHVVDFDQWSASRAA